MPSRKQQSRVKPILAGAAVGAAAGRVGADAFSSSVESYQLDKMLGKEYRKMGLTPQSGFRSGGFGEAEKIIRRGEQSIARGEKILRRSTIGGAVVGSVAGLLAARKKKRGGMTQVPDDSPGSTPTLSARDRLNEIIQLKAVDLGYSYDDLGCSPCAPDKKKHYPTLYVSDREQDIDLPLEGTAKVKFKLRSKTVRQNEEGKKRHSADIEIQSIDPIEEEIKAVKEGQPAKKIAMSATGPLHKLSARDQLALILLADPRPRNSLGEFSGDEEMGPSPQAMQITYGPANPGLNVGRSLAAGAVGGVGATGSGLLVKALIDKIKKKAAPRVAV